MLQENQVSKKNQELRMLVQNVRFFFSYQITEIKLNQIQTIKCSLKKPEYH